MVAAATSTTATPAAAAPAAAAMEEDVAATAVGVDVDNSLFLPDHAAAAAVAEAVAQAVQGVTTGAVVESQHIQSHSTLSLVPPPPVPRSLAPGWVRKTSRSQPNYAYYFQPETGICTWREPVDLERDEKNVIVTTGEEEQDDITNNNNNNNNNNSNTNQQQHSPLTTTTATTVEDDDAATNPTKKRSFPSPTTTTEPLSHKPAKLSSFATPSSSSSSNNNTTTNTTTTTTTTTTTPSKVRVLHILKKHKDSRRPSSWRVPHITITKDEARAELQELLDILRAEQSSGSSSTTTTSTTAMDELRATFEELARTESDCSSAKRGGDLGWFGRKKMQPSFEAASFALQVNELSPALVETSSGLHILLRIG